MGYAPLSIAGKAGWGVPGELNVEGRTFEKQQQIIEVTPKAFTIKTRELSEKIVDPIVGE